MTIKRYHERMMKLDECYNVLPQNSAKGMSAADIAEKLGKDRSTVHRYLNSLEQRGRVENSHGLWFAKTGEQTIQPLEKEIVIELPISKNDWQREAFAEGLSNLVGGSDPEDRNIIKISLEKMKETRTIRIKGKNVDDLDLEKLGKLIQEAYEKRTNFSLKRLFKRVRR